MQSSRNLGCKQSGSRRVDTRVSEEKKAVHLKDAFKPTSSFTFSPERYGERYSVSNPSSDENLSPFYVGRAVFTGGSRKFPVKVESVSSE